MKATLRVEGLHCAGCALTIDEAVEQIPGVRRSKTSLRRAQVKVDLDESVTSLLAVERAIEGAGYRAATTAPRSG